MSKVDIADYYQRAMINKKWPLGEDCYVYSMDGHPYLRGSDCDMAQKIELASFHCCDCFIFEEHAISLIEITDIAGTKKKLEEKFSDLTLEEKMNILIKNIFTETRLKMYGSMTVLGWVALDCKIMKNNMKKKYKFWLVIPSHSFIKNIKVFDMIEIKLKTKMSGIAPLIEVAILSPEKFEEKIKDNAISV